jgi:hypothetical protein
LPVVVCQDKNFFPSFSFGILGVLRTLTSTIQDQGTFVTLSWAGAFLAWTVALTMRKPPAKDFLLDRPVPFLDIWESVDTRLVTSIVGTDSGEASHEPSRGDRAAPRRPRL